MMISIVTNEPYHENSTIVGAFENRDAAVQMAVQLASDEPDENRDDAWLITEWDIAEQKQQRTALIMRRPAGDPVLNGFELIVKLPAGTVIARGQ
jgi:hypothetical protein